jgi:hypothetical protein
MIKCLINFLGILFLFSCLNACSHANNKPLSIEFTADHAAIEIKNINPAGLIQLKEAEVKDSTIQKLIFVLQTPSEKDSLIQELPIPGTIKLTDSSILFAPQHPFVKNRDYIVSTFINSDFADAGKMVTGNLSYGVKPYRKTLTR